MSYDLIDLKLVVAIVDCGSLTRAAKRLRLATSSASARLARLESMLQVTLFIRNARGLVATTGGKTMARHARQILVGLEQLDIDLVRYSVGAQSGLN